MEFSPIRSILEEDEDDEEPPRILFYHGKSGEAVRACAAARGEPLGRGGRRPCRLRLNVSRCFIFFLLAHCSLCVSSCPLRGTEGQPSAELGVATVGVWPGAASRRWGMAVAGLSREAGCLARGSGAGTPPTRTGCPQQSRHA